MRKKSSLSTLVLECLSDYREHTFKDISQYICEQTGCSSIPSKKISNTIYQLKKNNPDILMLNKGIYFMKKAPHEEILPIPPTDPVLNYVTKIHDVCMTMSKHLENPFDKWNSEDRIIKAHKLYHYNQKIIKIIGDIEKNCL